MTPDDLPDGRLSVCVFGPGHGEGILLRFPDGSIGTVDGSGRGASNAMLGVLRAFRARGEARLRFVAITHPHEDHLLGADELIREGQPEEIWFAGAQHPRLFRRIWQVMYGAYRHDPRHDVSDDEVAGALDRLIAAFKERIASGGCRHISLVSRMRLVEENCAGSPLDVRCLAPTQESLDRALSWLGTDVLRSRRKGRVLAASPMTADDAVDVEAVDRHVNEVSAVLLVQWGSARVLLMGDAERGDLRRGVGSLSLDRVHVVKVAHHASSGSHVAEVRDALHATVAIVTPFQSGRSPQPPQGAGLALHHPRDGRLYLTDPPLWHVAPLRRAGVPGARTHADSTHPESAVSVSLDAEGGLSEPALHGRAMHWPRAG